MSNILNKEDCKLFEAANTKTAKFTLKGYKTYAKCVYVYDGDTVHIVFKQPHSTECFKWVIRINGIDTPEMKGKDITEEEKIAAKNARDYVSNLVLNKFVRLENICNEKYGRILADVYIGDINLNELINIEQ